MNKIQRKPKDADKRVCIRVFDNKGRLIERSYGPSPEELRKAHDEHRCGVWCGICYDEAMATLNN